MVRSKTMTLAYRVGDGLYLNITNRCPCTCVFCIRAEHDGVGEGENLWLSREPSAAEVIKAIGAENLEEYREIVFCGYGEPTEALDTLLEVCRSLRRTAPRMPIRLNTNGLADLRHGARTAPLLAGLVDTVSISLNAPDAARYAAVTRPPKGEESFQALLDFAIDCKAHLPEVCFTVVDMLSAQELERCRALAGEMKIPLRVREKV